MPPTTLAEPKRNGLADLVCERPWALELSTLEMLRDLLASGQAVDFAALRARLSPEAQVTTGAGGSGSSAGPVAIIPITGILDQHSTWFSILFGDASCDDIRAALGAALGDPAVRAIILDVNSPGGSVSGITELAALIRAARGGAKPIVAVCDPLAASAAYWLAAQADEVVVTPSGRVGSIGIYTIHQEISRMLDAMGVTTTIISAGDHKIEGNEYEPLSDAARQATQDDVNTFYSMFVADVARGRRVSTATVLENYGQGRAPLAREALKAGMVDRVDTLEATVQRLAASVGVSSGRTRAMAALAWANQWAMAVPAHKTETDDGAWDGPANEARLPSPMPMATARGAYAWIDEGAADENGDFPKSACKFIHHEVNADGQPGSANLKACTSGIGFLNTAEDAPNHPDLPEDDVQGVYDHLAKHLRDAGQEPPALTGKAPFGERMLGLALEATALVQHATERARLRSKEARPAFSTATEAALRTTRAALDALLGTDEPAPSEPGLMEPAVEPPAPPAPPIAAAGPAAVKPRFRSTQEWLQYLASTDRSATR